MQFDIIGAGIGGLTTAIALEQKGFNPVLFEQAEELRPVGAGIILANNAMQVYEKLGLRKTIEKHGNPISSVNITRSNLDPLSKMDLSYFEQKFKVKNIAIHRGDLQQILIDKLQSTELRLGHKLKVLEKSDTGYELTFENGLSHASTTLLGADGLNSTVRKKIFSNNSIRHANQICWRGVLDFELPTTYKHEINEAWGKSERFGFVQISANKVYWYAAKSYKTSRAELSVRELVNYFKDFNPLVKEIISATPVEHINGAELSDLKPISSWYSKNVCLIGDAAHATTPNMGQGACQAIEDAYVLSECLDKYRIADKAFSTFQQLRLAKVNQVVKTSWRIGKMAHIENPLLIGLRNLLLRLTPTSVSRRQSQQLFELEEI